MILPASVSDNVMALYASQCASGILTAATSGFCRASVIHPLQPPMATSYHYARELQELWNRAFAHLPLLCFHQTSESAALLLVHFLLFLDSFNCLRGLLSIDTLRSTIRCLKSMCQRLLIARWWNGQSHYSTTLLFSLGQRMPLSSRSYSTRLQLSHYIHRFQVLGLLR